MTASAAEEPKEILLLAYALLKYRCARLIAYKLRERKAVLCKALDAKPTRFTLVPWYSYSTCTRVSLFSNDECSQLQLPVIRHYMYFSYVYETSSKVAVDVMLCCTCRARVLVPRVASVSKRAGLP